MMANYENLPLRVAYSVLHAYLLQGCLSVLQEEDGKQDNHLQAMADCYVLRTFFGIHTLQVRLVNLLIV